MPLPEPLAERYELDEAWQTTAFSIAYGGEAAADRVGEDTEAEHSAALAWDEDSLMTSCPRRCCLEEAPLAAPLHLLRGMPAAINGRSVDFLAFRRLVNQSTSPSRPASTSPHRTHRLDAYRLDLIRPLQATHSPPPRAPLQTRTKPPA